MISVELIEKKKKNLKIQARRQNKPWGRGKASKRHKSQTAVPTRSLCPTWTAEDKVLVHENNNGEHKTTLAWPSWHYASFSFCFPPLSPPFSTLELLRPWTPGPLLVSPILKEAHNHTWMGFGARDTVTKSSSAKHASHLKWAGRGGALSG